MGHIWRPCCVHLGVIAGPQDPALLGAPTRPSPIAGVRPTDGVIVLAAFGLHSSTSEHRGGITRLVLIRATLVLIPKHGSRPSGSRRSCRAARKTSASISTAWASR